MHGADVRVLELPGDLRFVDEETHARIGRVEDGLEHALHRDLAKEPRVLRTMHGAHPAARDLAAIEQASVAVAPVGLLVRKHHHRAFAVTLGALSRRALGLAT